eukprot:TRINITY_DN28741_c0_g1_i1.p1 TRINITY_DN28741_c0_g1~~TRINITY_DN28741_c0_g1_i1.p1  ORF type:complete len:318 (+),score=57.82 TRINITY_DN28741_c0_g1_i1:115-1068(+)
MISCTVRAIPCIKRGYPHCLLRLCRSFHDQQGEGDLRALRRQLETAEKERAELRGQVARLLEQSESMSKQMDALTTIIASHCSQNLMDIQSANASVQPSRADFRPLRDDILNQPNHVSQIGNRPLFELAVQGSHSANKERLIREIMAVDGLSWEEAHDRLEDMDEFNEQYYWLQTLPYRVAIFAAVIAACTGTAMVFYGPVAELYGTNVAKEELPDSFKEVSEMTTNQIGTWTWSWMEPMIGTASFVILCSQVARAQMWKLNMRPYTEQMLRARADRLAGQFPQYDRGIVRAWAKHLPMVSTFTWPTYRRHLGWRHL